MSVKVKKVQLVQDLQEIYGDSHSIIFTHYHGLTVSQLSSLRKSLNATNAKFKVVKNTLSKIAATNSSMSVDESFISGPVAIAYTKHDASELAKTVIEFSKINKTLKVVGAIVNNKIFNKKHVEQLAELPPLDTLRGKIIGLIQAPATKLAILLKTPASQVARVLHEHSKKH